MKDKGRPQDGSVFVQIYQDRYVPHYRLLHPDIRRFRFSVGFDLAGVDVVNRDVMDIGCGGGLCALYFSLVKGARHVFAVDSYEGRGNPAENKAFFEGILREYRLHERISMVHADACKTIPIPAESIDVAYMSSVLHHIYETKGDIRAGQEYPDHVIRFMENLNTACNEGGNVVVNEVLRHNIAEVAPAAGKVRIDWETKHNPEEWGALFAGYGFRTVAVDHYVPYPLRALRPILANRPFSYLLRSRYRMVLQKGPHDRT